MCTDENRLDEAILMRTHSIPHVKIENISQLCLLTWCYEKHSLARTTPVSNIFHDSKCVRVIEVLLYFQSLRKCFLSRNNIPEVVLVSLYSSVSYRYKKERD